MDNRFGHMLNFYRSIKRPAFFKLKSILHVQILEYIGCNSFNILFPIQKYNFAAKMFNIGPCVLRHLYKINTDKLSKEDFDFKESKMLKFVYISRRTDKQLESTLPQPIQHIFNYNDFFQQVSTSFAENE